ncbi:hypothetical protein E2C01_093480 [Portunus trituberculatus]|uniref:Uncharacterized protein n=1 Tax=Portunus trituberculatus TaxID=210409 RepID=A0A5B7JYD6_PORTR|nr:hypothetical protein [Portunus trituberculatus]
MVFVFRFVVPDSSVVSRMETLMPPPILAPEQRREGRDGRQGVMGGICVRIKEGTSGSKEGMQSTREEREGKGGKRKS